VGLYSALHGVTHGILDRHSSAGSEEGEDEEKFHGISLLGYIKFAGKG
jgi:hypothetical protein